MCHLLKKSKSYDWGCIHSIALQNKGQTDVVVSLPKWGCPDLNTNNLSPGGHSPLIPVEQSELMPSLSRTTIQSKNWKSMHLGVEGENKRASI